MNFPRLLRAWGRALRDSFRPRFLFFAFLCLSAGLVTWGILAWLLGGPVLRALTSLTGWGFEGTWGALLWALVTFPLVYLVALVLLSLSAFPWVRRVMRREGLRARASSGGIPLGRQVPQILLFSFLAFTAWFVSLLFFWVPLVPAVFAYAVFSWAQWRMVALDVWGETETPESLRGLVRKHRAEGWALSAGLAWLAAVPLVNFYLPVLAALAFLHWDRELQNEQV